MTFGRSAFPIFYGEGQSRRVAKERSYWTLSSAELRPKFFFEDGLGSF
jgi:hypothetical protein